MDNETKDGYLVSAGLIMIGLIFFYSSWMQFNIVFFIGIGTISIGIAGFKWPLVAEILVHWLKKQERNNMNYSKQSQQNTKDSTQANAQGDINIYNYKRDLPEEKELDEKKELIKEINQDLTKEKLSNILIKCIRLATITGSEKEKIWLEKEAQGLGGGCREVKKGTIPDYREINSKVRIAGENGVDYVTLDYSLGLIHPIFTIEGWIEEYEKIQGTGNMILTSQIPETFKKAHRDVFGTSPPSEDIPFVIPINELKKVLNGLKIKISKFVNSVK